MSTKSPSTKPKRKRTKEESKHETVAPVHKSNVKADNNLSDSPIPTDYEESVESNRTFIYEDKNDNVPPISRDISIDTGLQINCKIENGIIGFMEQEIKKEKRIGDSREHMIPNGKKKSKKSKKRESSPLPGTSHSKKKHRKRDEHEPRNDITVALEDLQDDVFEKDPNDVAQGDSQPRMPIKSNTVYVQKKNGFQATPRDRLFSSVTDINREEYNKSFSDMVPLDLALCVQKYWLPVTVLCNGLLAGLALTHIIVTRSNVMDEEFINQYKTYAEAYSTLFFLLCAISTISVFDRFDVKHMNCLTDIIYNRRSGFSILLYICALVVHSTNVKHDDHISLYNYVDENTNSTLEMMSQDDLEYWNTLSFWRSLLAIFGWVFVALGSSDDMLHVHLQSMERFIQNPA